MDNDSKSSGILNLVPNMITLCNLFTGFISMLLASQGHYKTALYLVILSVLWDTIDGPAAKFLKIPSELGKELDSLADLVSFVIAPCFVLTSVLVTRLNTPVFIILFVYLAAGTVRLAKFNLMPSVNDYFTGLPTPAAALTLNAALNASIQNGWTGEPLFVPGILSLAAALGALMVSGVRYPKFSGMAFAKWKYFLCAALILVLGVYLLVNFDTAIAVLPFFFTVFCPLTCLPDLGAQPQKS